MDIKTTAVYFYVQRDSRFYTSVLGSVLPWSRFQLNVGNAMSLTGIFTAPYSGVYYFSFSGVKYASQYAMFVYLRLNSNNIGLAEATSSGIDLYESMSLHSTLQLKKGDQIDLWISGQTYLFEDERRRTHFTGWLIEEDLEL